MSNSIHPQILLSTPHMGDQELAYVQEAFATNWIAPVGPHLQAFEQEFCQTFNTPTPPPSTSP